VCGATSEHPGRMHGRFPSHRGQRPLRRRLAGWHDSTLAGRPTANVNVGVRRSLAWRRVECRHEGSACRSSAWLDEGARDTAADSSVSPTRSRVDGGRDPRASARLHISLASSSAGGLRIAA
jgi:hypothetical protein